MQSQADQYMQSEIVKPPSQMGKFLRTAAVVPASPPRPSAPSKMERWYYRACYYFTRKFLKNSEPIHYARHLAIILAHIAKGPYTDHYESHFLSPCDAIALTQSLESLLDQLDSEKVVRNTQAFDPLESRTVRDFCTHEHNGQLRYADAGEHIAAHVVVIQAIALLLTQPASFFVGDNDEINQRLLTAGIKNLTVYMESVLALRL